MRFSALLLSLVIALGLTAPLGAKTRYKAPKVHHHSSSRKTPRVKHKPAKVKPMKFRKAKPRAKSRVHKAAKAHRVKRIKSV